MRKLNPSIKDGVTVTAHGEPVIIDGHTFTYAGHHEDRTNLDDKVYSWDWFDIISDDGSIIGRVSPYLPDDRVQALFTRIYRPEDQRPTDFMMCCRWPWKYKTDEYMHEDGTVERYEHRHPPVRDDRMPRVVTIPEDIAEEHRIVLDDEIKIEIWSCGPEPVALGRRLFHISQSGGRPALSLSVMSAHKKSLIYDDADVEVRNYDGTVTKEVSKEVYDREPVPGEYVAIDVKMQTRTGRRELADIPKQASTPTEPLTDRSVFMKDYCDKYIQRINDDIVRDRKKWIEKHTPYKDEHGVLHDGYDAFMQANIEELVRIQERMKDTDLSAEDMQKLRDEERIIEDTIDDIVKDRERDKKVVQKAWSMLYKQTATWYQDIEVD